MTVLTKLPAPEQAPSDPVLTIGNFDGVHKGHLALFHKVKERARVIEGTPLVITFEPHPLKVLRPEEAPPLITPLPQKLELIEKAGIQTILCLPFTHEFARMKAEEFVRRILVQDLGVREVVVGHDYRFGYGGKGDPEFLRNLARALGFRVHEVGPVHVNGRLVSSTSIRNLIRSGDLARAKELLGRDYQITGEVVRGKNRGGRLLGFPTANLSLVDELTPQNGVYAVKVLLEGATYNGVTNIGYNPTFGNGVFSVETHLLDFDGDLLGKTIRVVFIARLRDEVTFPDPDALSRQIAEDVGHARALLEAPPQNP